MDFSSTFDGVYKDSLWRIMAVDGTLSFKDQQNELRVHQDESQGKCGLLNVLCSSLSLSTTIETLLFPVYLHYRLDSWSSLVQITQEFRLELSSMFLTGQWRRYRALAQQIQGDTRSV